MIIKNNHTQQKIYKNKSKNITTERIQMKTKQNKIKQNKSPNKEQTILYVNNTKLQS